MTPGAGSTRADLVYQRLRTDILNGRLEPGQRLRVEQLSQDYSVSSGVLREALPRLAGEGLATLLPQQGYRVIAVSPEDLRHLTEARIAIETQVLRQSIASGSLDWESDVVAAHHTLTRIAMLTADGAVSEEWRAAHADFHRALLAGCPNIRLRAIAESMREVAEVYRVWSAGPGLAADRDVAAEHQALADAAAARDTESAAALLTDHIQLTTDLLLDTVSEQAT
jgi:DNA-binding GntR family transcriptional regulator